MKNPSRPNDVLRHTAVVSAGTLLSRSLGYVRDMLQAFFLGTGTGADALSMAFFIPQMLRQFTAEGTLTSAFIPVYTGLRKSGSAEDARRFVRCVVTLLALCLLGLTLLGMGLAEPLIRVLAAGFRDDPEKLALTVRLLRLMFPFMLFISLSAVFSAVLMTHFRFAVPSIAPAVFNLGMIAVVLLFARSLSQPAWAFALGVLVGGFLQGAVQVPFLYREGIDLRPRLCRRDPHIRRVGGMMGIGLIGLVIFQLTHALSRMLASLLAPGSVAALFYAVRLGEVVLGVFAIALARALFPGLSLQAKAGNLEEMRRQMRSSLRLITFITLPVALCLGMLAEPIVRILFERGAFTAASSQMTRAALIGLAAGLPFVSGSRVLSRSFFSLEDMKTPVKLRAAAMIVFLVCAGLMLKPLGLLGITLALSTSSAAEFTLHAWVLGRRIGPVLDASMFAFLGKLGVCAAALGIVFQWASPLLLSDFSVSWSGLAKLTALVLSGGLVYLAGAGLCVRRSLSEARRHLSGC